MFLGTPSMWAEQAVLATLCVSRDSIAKWLSPPPAAPLLASALTALHLLPLHLPRHQAPAAPWWP